MGNGESNSGKTRLAVREEAYLDERQCSVAGIAVDTV
jgi:hypothetical protein